MPEVKVSEVVELHQQINMLEEVQNAIAMHLNGSGHGPRDMAYERMCSFLYYIGWVSAFGAGLTAIYQLYAPNPDVGFWFVTLMVLFIVSKVFEHALNKHRLTQQTWVGFIASKLAGYKPLDIYGWNDLMYQMHQAPEAEWDAALMLAWIKDSELPEANARYQALLPRPTIKIPGEASGRQD